MKFSINRVSIPVEPYHCPCEGAIWYNGSWVIKLNSADDLYKLAESLDQPLVLWPKPKNGNRPLPLITIYDDSIE